MPDKFGKPDDADVLAAQVKAAARGGAQVSTTVKVGTLTFAPKPK